MEGAAEEVSVWQISSTSDERGEPGGEGGFSGENDRRADAGQISEKQSVRMPVLAGELTQFPG